MKLLPALAMMALSASAQTNITFTNLTGESFSNVEVHPSALGLIWVATNANSGGLVKWSNLNDRLRASFGYTPEAERHAETAAASRRDATLSGMAAAQKTALEKKRRDEADSWRVAVTGKVSQRVSDGIIVYNDTQSIQLFGNAARSQFLENGKQYPVHYGLCLLTGYTNAVKVGSKIEPILAYPDGAYEYLTVLQVEKGMRRFSVSPP